MMMMMMNGYVGLGWSWSWRDSLASDCDRSALRFNVCRAILVVWR